MNGFIIRDSNATDLHAILAIERANPTAAHWTEAEYAKVWTNSGRAWLAMVAESEGRPIGFAIAREVVREWELENIAIHPEFHRRGLGRVLLGEVLARIAKISTGERILLEVRESNFAARKLYESQGLGLCGRRKNYYAGPSEDALLFEKKFPHLSVNIR